MDPAAQSKQTDEDDAEYLPLPHAVLEVAPEETTPLPTSISAMDPAAQFEQADVDTE
jgi:hypothetical protein